MLFKIKVFANDKIVDQVRTHKLRRFFKKARTINLSDSSLKAYLRVDYGKSLDVYGKLDIDCNEGYCENEQDFWLAINAFTEKRNKL